MHPFCLYKYLQSSNERTLIHFYICAEALSIVLSFPFQHVISTLPAERFHLRDDSPYSIIRSRVRRRGGARYCGRPQDRRPYSALWP